MYYQDLARYIFPVSFLATLLNPDSVYRHLQRRYDEHVSLGRGILAMYSPSASPDLCPAESWYVGYSEKVCPTLAKYVRIFLIAKCVQDLDSQAFQSPIPFQLLVLGTGVGLVFALLAVFSLWRNKKKVSPSDARPQKKKVSPSDARPQMVETAKLRFTYDRSFLLSLQFTPICLVRPESLPNLEVVLNRPHTIMQSLPTEVKLKTSQNAWKPSAKKANVEDEAAKTAELVKKVRAILNKLTPEKFGKLSAQVTELPIDNAEKQKAVIDIIFEKAIDEQTYSATYAQLCDVLSRMPVQEDASNGDASEVAFKRLMVRKCQTEFQSNNMEEFLVRKEKELSECTDPAQKENLKVELDYQETKLKKRSVGNLKFIGELYKLDILTMPTMMLIVSTLLKKRGTLSLECLCKLLTTIGSHLEADCELDPSRKKELDFYFADMDTIVKERQCESRIRFLIMDVIDLRQRNWVPKRAENKPKTMAEVHEEIKQEEVKMQTAKRWSNLDHGRFNKNNH
ncbi:eukaryotic translation initiation factor 4 gamma 3-like [Penaeus indicus]|uniref:eukaryotic translation initiation factor 4 gamma 3-like n=1 Tax=Penaeus indicus TaxID=29960 RepID=UPI00300C6483